MNISTNSNELLKYHVHIDFDIAEKLWRENKKYIGNGMFKYICGKKTKRGTKCNNPPTHKGSCHLHCKDNDTIS